jgi:hypothetical protein
VDAGPPRSPVACGALGAYDLTRVRAIAARLGDGMRQVHDDGRSILFCDREPARWAGERERGLAWIEGDLWRGGPSSWQEAARLGGCGLVVAGRRPFLHSSISGLAPLYWHDDGRATYFASRLDALAGAAPRSLSVDWDAWAAMIALRYPLGERTPFAELRRLRPHATLARRRGRGRVGRPAWPWAEVEPDRGVDEGADAWVAAMRDALAGLGPEVLCPLSGGRDSRLVLCVLPDRSRATALTVADDEGGEFEEQFAVPVARALNVPQTLLAAAPEAYARDWEERARAVEYQFADHAWLVPLARRIAGARAPVLDGMAIDTFFQAGTRFFIEDALDTSRPRFASGALFDSLRGFGRGEDALEPGFAAPLVARAREQFLAELRPFEGHRSQAILGTYATRTVRGVAAYPSRLLGDRARVLVPAIRDEAARAVLAIAPELKYGGSLYEAAFERVAPEIATLPATSTGARTPPRLPRRWRSPAAVAAYRELLAHGPLAGHLAPALRSWLNSPSPGELDGHLRAGMEAIALFHAWWRRYRDRLGEVDGSELARG